MTAFIVEADGASRGNPGPAGYGAVVKDAAGRVLAEVAEAIGTATNNVAEYRGLIAGLRAVLDLAGEGAEVQVRMDSKLVVEQMSGRWQIRNEGLRPYAREAAALARRLRVTWRWVPRAENAHADRLANEAMDAAAQGRPWRSGAAAPAPPAPGRSPEPPPAGAADAPALFDAAGEPAVVPEPVSEPASGTVDAAGPEPAGAPEPGADLRTPPIAWRPPAHATTTLLLLRHGETRYSVERRFSGTGDPELTPRGLAQAEAAARRLAQERIDAIVSSPLRRARRTAEEVARRTGLEVVIEDGLRENDFGTWEGLTFAEIQARWPAELKEWLADPAVPPPGGESFAQAAERVRRTTERLLARHAGRTVLVVSHTTPIKMMLRFALAAPAESLYRMHLDLACLSRIDYHADGPAVVMSLNDTAHLR